MKRFIKNPSFQKFGFFFMLAHKVFTRIPWAFLHSQRVKVHSAIWDRLSAKLDAFFGWERKQDVIKCAGRLPWWHKRK